MIKKLNQILNNGKITIKTINIYLSENDEDIYKNVKMINEESKNLKEEIWVFFDKKFGYFLMKLIHANHFLY